MKVAVFCEESQEVCKAFRAQGHEAYSIDLQDCSGGHPEWHIKGDALKYLWNKNWDLAIAHPPCTRMANSGVRWLSSKNPRTGYSWSEIHRVYLRDDEKIWMDLLDAIKFFTAFTLYGKLGHRIAIEQPIHHKYAISEHKEVYTQITQPYQFGHKEKKATCLYLFGLPALVETNNVYKEMMELSYAERAKVHYASPGPDRGKIRSKTFPGIAKAMAEQWGNILTEKTDIKHLTAAD